MRVFFLVLKLLDYLCYHPICPGYETFPTTSFWIYEQPNARPKKVKSTALNADSG